MKKCTGVTRYNPAHPAQLAPFFVKKLLKSRSTSKRCTKSWQMYNYLIDRCQKMYKKLTDVQLFGWQMCKYLVDIRPGTLFLKKKAKLQNFHFWWKRSVPGLMSTKYSSNFQKHAVIFWTSPAQKRCLCVAVTCLKNLWKMLPKDPAHSAHIYLNNFETSIFCFFGQYHIYSADVITFFTRVIYTENT